MKKFKHGFALGKFMPLHKGHEAMIQFGMSQCEKFTIMVCALPTEPIDGKIRLDWMKELFPTATVAYLDDPTIPQEPAEHPDFWNLWRTAIKERVSGKVDAVFASESYGWRLAEELSAQFVPFDIDRKLFPISGTKVRSNPYKEWEFLTRPVREYYVKRVALLGPESVGKTTLTARLAERFATKAALEYARPLFDEMVAVDLRKEKEFRYEDLSKVARGQFALEDTLAKTSNKVLFTDTDVITTITWSQYLYGKHEDWMIDLAKEGKYDLTIILHPEDSEYVQDGQRVMEDVGVREIFLGKLIKNLESIGREYVVVRGDYQEREEQVVELTKKLLQGEDESVDKVLTVV